MPILYQVKKGFRETEPPVIIERNIIKETAQNYICDLGGYTLRIPKLEKLYTADEAQEACRVMLDIQISKLQMVAAKLKEQLNQPFKVIKHFPF